MIEPSDAEQYLRKSGIVWAITESGHGNVTTWSCKISWNVMDKDGIVSSRTIEERWHPSRSAAISSSVAEATSKGWKP